MTTKTKQTSGADERTPSVPQYFSWINNTDEGGTEYQTLANLDYFNWLYDTYGMQIKIYALDEGNIDGPSHTYMHPYESKKTLEQYPNGFGRCEEKARKFGCYLGIWAGADGYGDTEEEEEKRREIFVSLCRDHKFHEIKFDTVCDLLRPEKRAAFKKTVDECRKYVPDLIVLNHRQNLGEAEICATTFLLDGLETYVDVWSFNTTTGPHHRMAELRRNLVPGMQRLTEDHGVCISSSVDYFDDALVLQSFARNLILAPEIYGNPWVMNDKEHSKLARIYNLHAKYNDILVDGFALPEALYTKNSVSRGNGSTRLLTFTNPEWKSKNVIININEEIGLRGNTGVEYIIKSLHPYEEFICQASWNGKVEITLDPARATLILVEEKKIFEETDFVLTGCKYHTVYGPGAEPQYFDIYKAEGRISSIGNKNITADIKGDNTVKDPVLLSSLFPCATPSNARQFYEATCITSSNDAFEAQERIKSGETSIPQVKCARDCFFNQKAYLARGCENKFMFDGLEDTFFDGQTTLYKSRIDGGCLRVDLGEEIKVDHIIIKSVAFLKDRLESKIPNIPQYGYFSSDLAEWKPAPRISVSTTETYDAPICTDTYNLVEYYPANNLITEYSVCSELRYFNLPEPMDRIISFKIYDNAGKELNIPSPHATIMFAPWKDDMFKKFSSAEFTLPADIGYGRYIAVGIEGKHGNEGVYCGMECDGEIIGSYDRAVAHRVVNWEHISFQTDSGYTYYFKVTPDMANKKIVIYAMFKEKCDVQTTAWLCDSYAKDCLKRI